MEKRFSIAVKEIISRTLQCVNQMCQMTQNKTNFIAMVKKENTEIKDVDPIKANAMIADKI